MGAPNGGTVLERAPVSQLLGTFSCTFTGEMRKPLLLYVRNLVFCRPTSLVVGNPPRPQRTCTMLLPLSQSDIAMVF